ncbi:hypothetical protein ACH5RR_041784 [Cinchona calisaya]|uniref:Transcription factor MYC/MYB N-terminal domain-containing protein n=1 Tax=Cinchona calisaya TaxID=153742 RepID=A0ABD2XZS7_9GENT
MLTGSMGDSLIKDTLKNLSCNNGWSYGVFWRFDQKNSLLLTLQDLYCEEQMGVVIDDMLLQVHILGQGVIGEAAFTKTHRWMFADSHFGKPSPVGSIQSSLDDFQDHFEFDTQFSIGIKTIVVISVEPLGVVQFGSTQKFAERLDFVNQTKEHFQSIEILQGLALPENELMSLSSDAWDASSGLFASLISCESPNFECPTLQQGLTHEDFNETGFSAENVTGCSNLQHHQSLVESGSFIELLPSEGPCNSIWNNFNVQESSIMNSTCKSELLVDMVKTSQRFCESTVSNQNFGPLPHSSKNQLKMPSSLCTFDELFPKIDFLEALPNHDKNDDLLQWFSPTTDKSNEMITAKLRNDLSLTSEVVTLSSNPKAHQAPTKVISDKQPSPSVQSSVTNVLNSGQKEKYSDIVGVDKQFDCSVVDKRSKSFEDWEDTVKPVDIGGHLDFSVSSPDCISEQCIDSKFKTSKTLFSKLGLHQRLDEVYRGSCTAARSDFKDQLFSTVKRRKIESPLLSSSEVSCLTRFVGSVNSLQPANHLNSTSNFELKDKVIRKLETGSCVGDNCSIIAGNTVSSPEKPD